MLVINKEDKFILGELNTVIYESSNKKEFINYLIKEAPYIETELIDYKYFITNLLNEIGRNSPPISKSELINGHKVLDTTFLSSVRSWVAETFVSRQLPSEDINSLYTEWELIPLNKYGHESIELEDSQYWYLIDGDNNPITYDEAIRLFSSLSLSIGDILKVDGCDYGLFEDEDYVTDLELELNIIEAQPTLAFPFAWNTYWELPNNISEYLAQEAGFIVYRNIEEDELYIGLDGCGYDFYSHHWVPLYLSYCIDNKLLVNTSKGKRYILNT